MSDTKIISVPDSGASQALPWMAMNNGGRGNNGLFNNGLGTGILGFLLGAMFNGGFGGFGGFGNNGLAGAGYLGNQMNNNNNTDLLMNAITSQGERQHEAVQTLSNALGQDFNLVNSAIGTIQTSLATIAANQGMNTMQLINAVQAGNTALQNQICQCCCQTQQNIMQQGYENQIATLNQTNNLNATINANGQRNVDAIADLKTSMISEFCAARERDMQSKIDTQADMIGQLRSQIDNANQTNQIIGYVNSVVTPLSTKVNEIASKQLPTVPVVYPNIQAINNTPYAGGFYGNGWGNNIVF